MTEGRRLCVISHSAVRESTSAKRRTQGSVERRTRPTEPRLCRSNQPDHRCASAAHDRRRASPGRERNRTNGNKSPSLDQPRRIDSDRQTEPPARSEAGPRPVDTVLCSATPHRLEIPAGFRRRCGDPSGFPADALGPAFSRCPGPGPAGLSELRGAALSGPQCRFRLLVSWRRGIAPHPCDGAVGLGSRRPALRAAPFKWGLDGHRLEPTGAERSAIGRSGSALLSQRRLRIGPG